MEHAKIQNKVKLLFEKISEPQYVMNNYYTDHFFIKINSSDPDVIYLKAWPVMPDLLIEALNHMEKYHNTVKVFLIRMIGVFAQGEVHFGKIFSKKGDEIAKAFKEMNSQNMDTSLRVAYMEVALSLVNHNSGIYWLFESDVWKDILSLCNEKRTVFVVRQTYKFAALFLWSLNTYGNEANINNVLSFIIKPLTDTDFMRIDSLSAEEEDVLCKTLEPMYQILLAIISHDGHIKTRNCIIDFMLKDHKILTYCYILLDRLRRKDISLLITKFLFWLCLGKIFHLKPIGPNVIYNQEDLMDLNVVYFNIIQRLIQRRCTTLIFDFCTACNLIWVSVWNKQKPEMWQIDDTKFEMPKKLLVLCLVPSMVYAFNDKRSAVTCEGKTQDYVAKIMNSFCEHTARTAYALRDLMSQLDVQTTALQSMKRLTCLKDHLNNEQANLVFQSLFYILNEFSPLDEDGVIKTEMNNEDDQEKVLVMTYVLDTVLSLVKNYNINWQESLEVICLYTVVFNVLKRTNLSCKFVVAALSVITVTVKKFLPPNLSLLLEAKPGSTIHDLGKLIYMKMHDFNWEVRDSALELLYVCTDISFIKFPPFQKQILSNNLINVAATMAMNDHEFYVRVSALKCLGAASKVCSLWEQLLLEHPMIQEQLLSILSNNPEGIVRREACSVLCEIYQNVKLNRNFKLALYDRMVTSALCDFHWEVQLTALKFWKIVIQSLLNDQGMLDGTFPPVTFSRETRKIVTLNAMEIQRRLTRILEELASIGCLTVLIKLLSDETEVEIMDSALAISTELLDILDRYKVPGNLTPNENELKSEEMIKKIKLDNLNPQNGIPGELESSDKADNVIESIINADDINLLANIYERHMTLQSQEKEPEVLNVHESKLLKFASPYMFVSFVRSKDFKEIIEEKKNWKDGIKSLSSLLDDVLGIYEVNEEINALDCY